MTNFSVTTERITPQKAIAYLRYNWDKQRRLDKRHVAFCAKEMKAGRWGDSDVRFALASGEDPVLFDGQHTLSAIVEAGTPQVVTVKRYQLESIADDLPPLFARVDRGKRRTTYDSLAGFGVHERLSINKTNAGRIVSAVKFLRSGLTGRNLEKTSVEAELGWLEDWSPHFLKFADATFGFSISGKMLNRAILSVGMITFKHQPSVAAKFWHQVAKDDRLSATDPRKVLHSKILVSSVNGGSAVGRQAHSAPVYAAIVAKCWNAYFEGKEILRFYTPSSDSDIVVLGVPPEEYARVS